MRQVAEYEDDLGCVASALLAATILLVLVAALALITVTPAYGQVFSSTEDVKVKAGEPARIDVTPAARGAVVKWEASPGLVVVREHTDDPQTYRLAILAPGRRVACKCGSGCGCGTGGDSTLYVSTTAAGGAVVVRKYRIVAERPPAPPPDGPHAPIIPPPAPADNGE